MKRWQSLFIALGLLAATALWAVPTFTPTLDGIQDAGWGAVPDHSTTSVTTPLNFNLDGGMYVTDDNEYVYFGFPADDDPLPLDGARPHIHILVDVGNTAAGGTFAAWGAGGVQYTMPYRPEYDIVTQWGPPIDSIEYTGLNTWTTTGGPARWVETQILTDAGGGGLFTEIAVSRLALGNPAQGTTLNLTMWLRPSYLNTPGGNCILPELSTFPTTNGGAARPISVQFPYTIQTVYGDPVPPRLIQVHQIDRNSVELVFNEAMNMTTLQQSGNYTLTGWIQTGFRYITPTTVGFWNALGFVDGSYYSVALLPAITDLAGNPIDPAFNSLGWTAPTYSSITFLVHDPGATQDSLDIRGSYNFYHEYDAGWSGSAFRMYDDGTHGDAVAGDHTHTLVIPLVSNGGTPNFEWKYVTNEGVWQPNPNNSFSLPDANPLTVEYTIPDPITQNVTVTFNVDMRCVIGGGAEVDSVTIAGGLNNWGSSTMSNMGGGIYSMDALFLSGASTLQEFKYRYHYTTAVDTPTVWEGVGNRILTIDDSSPTQVLPTVFFNDAACTPLTQDVTVTFFVDMQCISATIDRMELVGSFTGWALNPIVMTDLLNGQYSVDVLFPAGSLPDQTFKFRRIEILPDPDPPYEDWETVDNRVLTIPDLPAPYVLGNIFFNDWLCPPVDLTAIRVGDNLHLQWVGPQRAHYQVWEHTSPDNVTVDGILLTTVSDSFFDIFLETEATPPKFYQIIATMPTP